MSMPVMKKLAAAAVLALFDAGVDVQPSPSTSATATYHTVAVDGVRLFYREAGPKDAPTILLLHGYPSSSRMFATLIPLLADRYHLVAPDYPGFGQSDAPAASEFRYTFDHLAEVVDHFTQALGLTS
jgi:pimeloyl-ACP methyl ester carboxylesterase